MVTQAAKAIEDNIESGYWKDILPGSRTLAEMIGVSRNTAIAAIKVLEEKGVVLPASERGKARSICTDKSSQEISVRNRNLLFLHPKRHQLDKVDQAILSEIRAMWRQGEGEFFPLAVDFQKFNRCEAKLNGLVKRFSADALTLLNPTKPWALQAHNMLPTFLLGGDVPKGWEGNLIAYSIYETLLHALNMLKKGRHTRVLIPSGSLGIGYRNAAITAHRSVYGNKTLDLTAEDYCPNFKEATAECWQGYWADSFPKTDPTAVILSDAKYACSLYSYCLRNEIRIPEDLIVIVLGDCDLLEWFWPAPIMYHFPIDKATGHFRKWMTSDLGIIGSSTPVLRASL